jgi:hypothetical protein
MRINFFLVQFKRFLWLLASLAAVLYLLSMCLAPFIQGNWSWTHVQRVWWTWQSLNVGFIALASSLVALRVVTYREDKQRKREFIAARAFLPHALSELCSYSEDCAEILVLALAAVSSPNRQPITLVPPDAPVEYKSVFQKCILSAESDVAEYLASIINKLQVHQSRLQSVTQDLSSDRGPSSLRINILSYLVCLGEIRALANNLFDFSRGNRLFKADALAWADYRTAYLNLGGLLDKVPDLAKHARVPGAPQEVKLQTQASGKGI